MLTLELPSSLATNLASGHPWVYRDHVGNFSAPNGSWVRLRAGSFTAVGLWDSDSAIALRVFSTKGEVNEQWVRERIVDAWTLRAPLRALGVTGYRLVFGEADGLPGIVVDLYGECAVLVTYAKSLGKLCAPVAAAVAEVTGCSSVVRRTKVAEIASLQPLVGQAPTGPLLIVEHGMLLEADLVSGQKTGLFFDHRENRRFVREQAEGKSVLNLFSYTGGFSVAAALGGARDVTSVDIAKGAVRTSEANFRLNGLHSTPHRAIAEDAFQFLERAVSEGSKYDLVVCDPPSFAKTRAQQPAAEKAYRRLLALAFAVVVPGGQLCAASCTSQVGPAAFRVALADAARKARKRFLVCHDIGQPLDHPVHIAHEEGRYLKFVAGRVTERI